ncbi:tRNA lysidine(34) synthetase TilS [Rosenbergiella australiborealis]|uniref:tRNA(Ile)-lysidine synthase n=1 Tax=Rosenbergiella australiborealis TaxID=1544696 RepID=A0ABS5T1Q4_9GAMM|nr:tRNA lysidine(34) synthetase TilS [Rosenbergiella australiborealis]
MAGDLQLNGHQQLLIGFSGGLDSTVLVHQLAELRHKQPLTLRAVYIHHGLSHFADEWLDHCQQVCNNLQIPFISRHVQLLGGKGGIEAEARALRYQEFSRLLTPGEALVTAHHQDDQCETLLLALKRGSGPAGLSAMPVSRQIGDHWHLRPLLNFSRQALENYADKHQLSWIDDESNQDDRYDRNFLRLHILPYLTQRWPHFAQNVARSAELCGEQEALLDELLAAELQSSIAVDGSISIAPLADCTEPKRNALLRRWLTQRGAPLPSRQALIGLWHEVALSRKDASPELRMEKNGYLRRYQQRLYYGRAFHGLQGKILPWDNISNSLVLPDNLGMLCFQPIKMQGKHLRLPTAEQSVSIRFGQSAHLHLVGRHGGRSLKKIWQEKGVPTWLRTSIPLVYYDEELVCAPGIFITQAGISSGEGGHCLQWLDIEPELKPWINFSSEQNVNFE